MSEDVVVRCDREVNSDETCEAVGVFGVFGVLGVGGIGWAGAPMEETDLCMMVGSVRSRLILGPPPPHALRPLKS